MRSSTIIVPLMLLSVAGQASAQVAYVSRHGQNIGVCGSPQNGQTVVHSFTTIDDVHDVFAIASEGSESTASFDSIHDPRGIDLHFAGSATRTPNTYGTADGRDTWIITISEPYRFTLDVSLRAATTDGFVSMLSFTVVTSSGRIDLDDGSFHTVLSQGLSVPSDWSESYSGTLHPGEYTVALSARVDGGAGFWSGSYDAALSLNVGCEGDFNGDGVLNVFDFLSYQSAFSNGDDSADLAAPFGVLNVFDFLAFQSAFSEGC